MSGEPGWAGVEVRDAGPEDVDAIVALGRGDEAFRVSEGIQFYEREELVEWVGSPRENILCVAVRGREVVGFLYCKVMSWHWAMLDNFYATPAVRGSGVGALMLEALLERLRRRGVAYLTTLVEVGRDTLAGRLEAWGFGRARSYDWFELLLDGERGRRE